MFVLVCEQALLGVGVGGREILPSHPLPTLTFKRACLQAMFVIVLHMRSNITYTIKVNDMVPLIL